MSSETTPNTPQKPKRSYFTFAHIAGVLAAIIAYFVIYKFTGDSDLMFAIGSGMGVWAVTWSLALLHWRWK